MKRLLAALAFVAIAAAANALTPQKATAGSWEDVCCGASCIGGEDYCLGNGDRTCCKTLAEE